MLTRKIIIVLTLWCCVALLFADEVWAWGAGMHIAQGEFVFDNLKVLLPAIRELLRVCPLDFFYGLISADIFIGKGSKKRDDHCHNWSIGQKMLSLAQAPSEKAFVYGYLSHLAADTVAHNFYIPNQLYLTSTTRKFGHLYWEYRSDVFTEKKHWKMAKEIILGHDPQNDRFIMLTIPNRLRLFKTKKRIFSSVLHLHDLDSWHNAVMVVSQNSRWEVKQDYIEFLKKLSFYLTLDFLQNPESALCLRYDPVGSDSICEAKKRRRLVRKITGARPSNGGFQIPAEMLALFNTMDAQHATRKRIA